MVGTHPMAMAPIAMVTSTEREVGDGRVVGETPCWEVDHETSDRSYSGVGFEKRVEEKRTGWVWCHGASMAPML